ncbi:hypothetical protein BC833DRAFT_607014 [Globomyces pollinis-pini]|nr:hypothetical protein BC833DRAFT_607014 [Globomyces pollinis-pini]
MSDSLLAWTKLDDQILEAAATFSYMWIGYLITEVCVNFEFDFHWITIGIQLLLRTINSSMIILYYRMVDMENSGANTAILVHYVLNIVEYALHHFTMYKRKRFLAPETTNIDEISLAVCTIPCVVGTILIVANGGFANSMPGINLIAASFLMNLFYFDIYFCCRVAYQSKGRQTLRQVLVLLLPTYWTFLSSTGYFAGAIMYTSNTGNFFSNGLWSLFVTIIPLLSIQSIILSTPQKPSSINKTGL